MMLIVFTMIMQSIWVMHRDTTLAMVVGVVLLLLGLIVLMISRNKMMHWVNPDYLYLALMAKVMWKITSHGSSKLRNFGVYMTIPKIEKSSLPRLNLIGML